MQVHLYHIFFSFQYSLEFLSFIEFENYSCLNILVPCTYNQRSVYTVLRIGSHVECITSKVVYSAIYWPNFFSLLGINKNCLTVKFVFATLPWLSWDTLVLWHSRPDLTIHQGGKCFDLGSYVSLRTVPDPNALCVCVC